MRQSWLNTWIRDSVFIGPRPFGELQQSENRIGMAVSQLRIGPRVKTDIKPYQTILFFVLSIRRDQLQHAPA
jgi:hypothetical protein